MPVLPMFLPPFPISSGADRFRGYGVPAAATSRISSPEGWYRFALPSGLQGRSQKWRAENPGYWKPYREAHPDQADRNRALEQARGQKRRVRDPANNNLALDLKSSTAAVWLFGPAASHLTNNTLATTQVFIVEGFNQRPRNLANNNALASAPARVGRLSEQYRRLRQARAAVVRLHQQMLHDIDRLEQALRLPPPPPARRPRAAGSVSRRPRG